MPRARRSSACSSRVRRPTSPHDPAASSGTRSRKGLRWLSPIGTQTRRALVDVELGGVTLPAGANLGPARLVREPRRGRLGADRRRVRHVPPAPEPRRVRLRAALLLGPPLLARADAHRARAAARAAPRDPPRSRAAAGVRRLGVPRAAAPPRPLGRMTWVDVAERLAPGRDGDRSDRRRHARRGRARRRASGTRSRRGARTPSARSRTGGSRAARSAARATGRSSTSRSGEPLEGPADRPVRTFLTRVVSDRVEVEVA